MWWQTYSSFQNYAQGRCKVSNLGGAQLYRDLVKIKFDGKFLGLSLKTGGAHATCAPPSSIAPDAMSVNNAHFMKHLHGPWFLLLSDNWRKMGSKLLLQHHPWCFLQFHTFHEPLHATRARECMALSNNQGSKVFQTCSKPQHLSRPGTGCRMLHTSMFHSHPYIHKDLVSIQQTWLGKFF